MEKRDGLILELSRAKEGLERGKMELVRSNADLFQFARIAAHDLRSPLNTVGSYLSLLERKYGAVLDEKAHEYIFAARAGIKRMDQLVSSLLDLARIDVPERNFSPVDCNVVLKQTLSNLTADIAESRARIDVRTLPVLNGDPAQLVQLFQNLISNAIKYRRAGIQPVILISAESRSDEWIFSVKDNGIGIRQEALESIFEPLKRLHTETDYRGTGLGLSICRKIVERHGGKIWADSAQADGSTFSFTMPKK